MFSHKDDGCLCAKDAFERSRPDRDGSPIQQMAASHRTCSINTSYKNITC